MKLTESEKHLWESAYGTAFALAFKFYLDHKGWDGARAAECQDEAEGVANEAVIALRKHRKTDNSVNGHAVGAPSEVDDG
jgi:hypothetical protein